MHRPQKKLCKSPKKSKCVKSLEDNSDEAADMCVLIYITLTIDFNTIFYRPVSKDKKPVRKVNSDDVFGY